MPAESDSGKTLGSQHATSVFNLTYDNLGLSDGPANIRWLDGDPKNS